MQTNWQDNCPSIGAALNEFPPRLHMELRQVAGSGVMRADQVFRICEDLDIDSETLMLKLVPLAAAFGVAPVSSFRVGAVARGQRRNSNGFSALYLGANMEFPQQALCYSLHAEQAAVANAWTNREPGLTSLAVSAPPCGHCRQFLYELHGCGTLSILFPGGPRNNHCELDISELLPGAFGPMDLGQKGNMMAATSTPQPLRLQRDNRDHLILRALDAACFSYAPYTGNHSGCALQFKDGSIFSGSYAENAAHNPGLSPLHAALSNFRMACGPGAAQDISRKLARCALVESAATISQRAMVTTLLSSIAPGVAPEYYPARIITV
ncbi:cytidine deaminase [Microbulbifer harenosus]|uniref:Cytidine deaminase n=2 Tax=Microbulbifer harenosus TaxID=2576840 RepID=A0ABY2UGV1_9GAMM|nr:cytidine deaminase [Microbulbifer harenosus]